LVCGMILAGETMITDLTTGQLSLFDFGQLSFFDDWPKKKRRRASKNCSARKEGASPKNNKKPSGFWGKPGYAAQVVKD